MCLFRYDDDPEPEERVPAGLLYVPVRPGTAETVVRMFRTPLGARTAVGFTCPDRLAAVLGAEQPWIRLSEAALRAMTEPLGAALLTVDPTFTAPAVAGPVAEPAVPDPARTAAVGTGSARAGAERDGTVQAGTAQTGAVQTGTAQTGTARAGTVRTSGPTRAV
ncbi:SAV_915 family protein [Streptomyces sp. NPDC089799]|uniref:SAV_915 family protein n=1 Tax=Streptomyces sp. NPDC089799 TaxID=3155066 RepID=UPI0034255B92